MKTMLFEPINALYSLAMGPTDGSVDLAMSPEEHREFLSLLAVQVDRWAFIAHERIAKELDNLEVTD